MNSDTHPSSASGAGPGPAIVIRTPAGVRFELNPYEYRLALLGLVDFGGAWEVLEQAAGFVVDGPAKAAIVRDRLRPLGSHLPALLARGVDSIELLAARFWFRQEKIE